MSVRSETSWGWQAWWGSPRGRGLQEGAAAAPADCHGPRDPVQSATSPDQGVAGDHGRIDDRADPAAGQRLHPRGQLPEGSLVKAGQLLFTLDDRPFRAAVGKAQGDYANAIAQLQKAKSDVKRYTPLVAQRAISREQLDNARAAVLAGQGSVQASKGALQTAKLNLEWSKVRAPITGLAGLAQARVGTLVNPNQVLTVVSTLDPHARVVQPQPAGLFAIRRRNQEPERAPICRPTLLRADPDRRARCTPTARAWSR